MLTFAEGLLRIASESNQAADMKFLTLLDDYVGRFQQLRKHVRELTDVLPSLPLGHEETDAKWDPRSEHDSNQSSASDDELASAVVTQQHALASPGTYQINGPPPSNEANSGLAIKPPKNDATQTTEEASAGPEPNPFDEPSSKQHLPGCGCPVCEASSFASDLAYEMNSLAENFAPGSPNPRRPLLQAKAS